MMMLIVRQNTPLHTINNYIKYTGIIFRYVDMWLLKFIAEIKQLLNVVSIMINDELFGYYSVPSYGKIL